MMFQSHDESIRYLFSRVPFFNFAKKLVRACGQSELEGEPKHTINALEKVQAASHLLLDLSHNQLISLTSTDCRRQYKL